MSEKRSIILSSTDSPQKIETFLNLLIQWKKEEQSLDAAQAAKLKDSTKIFFKDKQENTIAFMSAHPNNPNNKTGFIWLQKWDNLGQTTSFINEFWVRADCRGEGIGRLLMDQGLAWAINMKASQCQLNVSSNNLGAIRFYEKYGFKKQPENTCHKYFDKPPNLTQPENIIIQERKKGESDQALWNLSKTLHFQNHAKTTNGNLKAEEFKQWQARWDFDKEELLVVFKVYKKDQDDEDALIGYAWGEKLASPENKLPKFLLHEWTVIPDHPEREKISLFLLKVMIHTLFQRGFQIFQAATLTDFQRSAIKKLGFQPSSYLMTKTLSGK